MAIGRLWYQLAKDSYPLSREQAASEAKRPRRLEKIIRYDDSWSVVCSASQRFYELSDESAQLRILESLRENPYRFAEGWGRFDWFVMGMYRANTEDPDRFHNFVDDMTARGLYSFVFSLAENEDLRRAVIERLMAVDRPMAEKLKDEKDFPEVVAAVRQCLGLPDIGKDAGEFNENEQEGPPNIFDELRSGDVFSEDKNVRAAVIARLVEGGLAAVSDLRAALVDTEKNHSLKLRELVAWSLVEIGDSQGIATVRRVHKDTEEALERQFAPPGDTFLLSAITKSEWAEFVQYHSTRHLVQFYEALTNALRQVDSILEKSAQQSLWIFNKNGNAVGLWVSAEYAGSSNLSAIVRMLYAARAKTARENGKEMRDLGFSDPFMIDIQNQRWRVVANDRTAAGGGNAIAGGAFLMTEDALAPNEFDRPEDSFEVREAASLRDLIEISS